MSINKTLLLLNLIINLAKKKKQNYFWFRKLTNSKKGWLKKLLTIPLK